MVTALSRKLLRDLLRLRGQVLTIALVVACGISSYVTMRTAFDSLVYSRDRYYHDYRFGDVFGTVQRAPDATAVHLAALDGVARLDTRIVETVLVPMPNMARPASGTIIGLNPHERESRLNDVHIKRGRELDPAHHEEVLVLDAFAEAHGLEPGDTISAVLNGSRRRFRIVGLALSPEYVLAIAPGALSYDPAQVPVLWVNEEPLEAAYKMEGSFNSFSMQLQPQASMVRILAETDQLMRPYGGFGAVSRNKQTSNYMLESELVQLESMAGFAPFLFLFVAALLVNVVFSRLVQLQRQQVATLKAVGYSDRDITLHYLSMVSTVVVLGAILGIALGAWLGNAMTQMYTGQFFRFPNPEYQLHPRAVVFSVAISIGSAVIGAWWAVRNVVQLPPAEAMRPPAPARYKRSMLEHLGLWRLLSPSARMIWRELSRHPLRLAFSALGISLATGLVIVARSMWDAMDDMMVVQFHRGMREDTSVTFAKPLSPRAIRELEHIPGVFHAEGLRSVPVRFESANVRRDSVVTGYPEDMSLRRLLDLEGREHQVPEQGVMLTGMLAQILGVGIGDPIRIQFKEGQWHSRDVLVTALIDEAFGLAGHMSERSLRRHLGDQGAVTSALLRVDPDLADDVERRLKPMPWVASVASPRDLKKQFDEQSAAIIAIFTLIMTIFSAVIAVGVIYNNARVALSQRSRDLASLRVLGFTRSEIAGILFGEQAIQVALAIPLGLYVGRWLSAAMMANVDPEAYRFNLTISEQTYVFAVSVTLGSALVSALLLRRKLYALDLIGVLKTRD